MKSGVYNIINLCDGKVYVGSSVDVDDRLCGHVKGLRQNKHPNIVLQRAWNKHGESVFHFAMLKPCLKSRLIVTEQFCIDQLQSADRRFGYNLAPTAGSALGVKWSSSSKRKRSKMLLEYCKDPLVRQGMSERGKAYNKAHPEFGLALSKAGADAKRGTTTSDATKAKMAEARREHWANLTPEQRTDREYKCGNAMRGKHLTDEHRNRVSVGLSATLAELTPEQRSERMRAAREARTFGPHSEAHNKKISDSLAATLAKLSPNQLSERSRKAWVTRRQNTQEVSRHAS